MQLELNAKETDLLVVALSMLVTDTLRNSNANLEPADRAEIILLTLQRMVASPYDKNTTVQEGLDMMVALLKRLHKEAGYARTATH